MFSTLKKHIKNEKGLSLVELLAVIVILAIIAAIAIPAIGNIIANSRVKSEISDAVQILNAAKLYELDGNTLPFTNESSNADNYIEFTDRINTFSVSKSTSGEFQITFDGDNVDGTNLTLTQLNNATVEDGTATFTGTTGGGGTETGTD